MNADNEENDQKKARNHLAADERKLNPTPDKNRRCLS
jgi:hypothetical protein